MELYFTWNGIDSRDYGLVLQRRPDFMVPAERVQLVDIPGRSGSVTLAEGVGVYAGYVLTLEVGNRRTSSPSNITRWLRGEGELVLSCEPDRCYHGRLIQQASLEHLFKGVYSGKISFNMHPLKGQYPPEPDIELTNYATIFNPGDVHARPIYTLYGSDQLRLYINRQEGYGRTDGSRIDIDLTGTSLTGAVIDTDAMLVTSLDGSENLNFLTTIYYSGAQGLWLPTGSNRITWYTTTMTKVVVRPRWRWL